MTVKSIRWCGVAVILAASVCLAQEPPEATGGKDEPERAGRRERGRRGDRQNPRSQMDRLIKKLKLDEEQQSQTRALYETHKKQMGEVRDSLRPTPETREKMKGFREEMRAAREANDEARVKQLREEMRAVQEERRARLAPLHEKREAARKELHDGLLAVMHEDQKEPFEELWKKMHEDRGPRPSLRDPRMLKAAVDKLSDVTSEQQEQLDALFAAFMKDSRDVEKKSKEHKKLSGKLYGNVMQVLTPEQQERITKQMRGRRHREGRRERRGEHRGKHRHDGGDHHHGDEAGEHKDES